MSEFAVFARDLIPILKTTVTAMRKIPAAERRKNPIRDAILLASSAGFLAVRTFDPDGPEGYVWSDHCPLDFQATITLSDAHALVTYLNRKEAVIISKQGRQTVFAQPSRVKGRMDTMAFNPAPPLAA